MVLIGLMSISFVPEEASASVSNVDAIASIISDSFQVEVKWIFTEWDSVTVKLYHNSIEVATSDTSYGSSGEESDYVSYSPLKKGTYRVQLWSETDNKELYSKEWTMPNLDISLSVTPTSGQIGTMFIATTTMTVGNNAPEFYYFSGNLELNAGSISIKQNIGGALISDDYYDFYDIDDYEINPIFTSTGFTFPTADDYTISAKYSDSITEITASSKSVEMIDQYNPLISKTNTELSNTKDELNSTKDSLTKTSQDLTDTKKELESTKENLQQTEDDLNGQIADTKMFAFIGILVGIVGIIMGIVGIAVGKKNKQTRISEPPEETRTVRRSQYSEPPRQEHVDYPPESQGRARYDDYQRPPPRDQPPRGPPRETPREPPRDTRYPPQQPPQRQQPPSSKRPYERDDMNWED